MYSPLHGNYNSYSNYRAIFKQVIGDEKNRAKKKLNEVTSYTTGKISLWGPSKKDLDEIKLYTIVMFLTRCGKTVEALK